MIVLICSDGNTSKDELEIVPMAPMATMTDDFD
jgi:hypothetical protein